MTRHTKVYNDNPESFLTLIEDAFVSGPIYNIDSKPTFDIKKIPFAFLYGNSVSFLTDKGNFDMLVTIPKTA